MQPDIVGLLEGAPGCGKVVFGQRRVAVAFKTVGAAPRFQQARLHRVPFVGAGAQG
ncbi:hypothetical protein GM668_30315, partial [Duganella ginsengisoli]|nr:hypothetical protein [Pseudoduganella ginsengisoli]